jgi:hypothetical protein
VPDYGTMNWVLDLARPILALDARERDVGDFPYGLRQLAIDSLVRSKHQGGDIEQHRSRRGRPAAGHPVPLPMVMLGAMPVRPMDKLIQAGCYR